MTTWINLHCGCIKGKYITLKRCLEVTNKNIDLKYKLFVFYGEI